MADRFPLIANSSANQIQEIASGDNLDLSGSGIVNANDIEVRNITGVAATFSGVLSYEDVTNIDSIGVVTARSGVEFGASGVGGTITATGNAEFVGIVTAGIGAATETVSVASTSHYITDKSVTLELDCTNGTIFTHDLDNGNVGIVSIRNFRVDRNSFTTATVIFTQGGTTPASGAGNTMVADVPGGLPGGIGTHIQLTPKGVTGFATDARVGSATTVVLSTTAGDLDVVTFGIHYNGSGTGDANNYRTLITKSGDIRVGGIGQ